MDLTNTPITNVLTISKPIFSLMPESERDHQEQAEKIAKRDAKIIRANNNQRYNDALNEAEAFFNTMYPVAIRHAKVILGKHKSKQKVDNIMFTERLLQGYLGIWNTMLGRKYK